MKRSLFALMQSGQGEQRQGREESIKKRIYQEQRHVFTLHSTYGCTDGLLFHFLDCLQSHFFCQSVFFWRCHMVSEAKGRNKGVEMWSF